MNATLMAMELLKARQPALMQSMDPDQQAEYAAVLAGEAVHEGKLAAKQSEPVVMKDSSLNYLQKMERLRQVQDSATQQALENAVEMEPEADQDEPDRESWFAIANRPLFEDQDEALPIPDQAMAV